MSDNISIKDLSKLLAQDIASVVRLTMDEHWKEMSTAPSKPSHRALQLARRRACDAGMQYVMDRASILSTSPDAFRIGKEAALARLYPLPTKTVPREVRDPHNAHTVWSMRDEKNLAYQTGGGGWISSENWIGGVTPSRAYLWAELLRSPTEDVEDTE